MKKLNRKKKQKVVGGAGSAASITGAFLNGISSIISSIGGIFSSIIGSIVTAIHSFTDKDHVKAEYKFGSTGMSYDDSKALELEKEALKQEPNVIKIKPRVSHEQFSNQTVEQNFTENLETPSPGESDDLLTAQNFLNETVVSEDYSLHEFY